MTATGDRERDRLRATAERVAASHGLELFDVQVRREAIGLVLRVIIDRIGPPATGDPALPEELVGIEDCQRVSRDLSAILDAEEDLTAGIDRHYTLEVSSPGLDRPLRGEADYRRFVGRLAKIVTTTPVNGQSHFEGRLAGFENGQILVDEGKRQHRVPLTMVRRARLEVEF